MKSEQSSKEPMVAHWEILKPPEKMTVVVLRNHHHFPVMINNHPNMKFTEWRAP